MEASMFGFILAKVSAAQVPSHFSSHSPATNRRSLFAFIRFMSLESVALFAGRHDSPFK